LAAPVGSIAGWRAAVDAVEQQDLRFWRAVESRGRVDVAKREAPSSTGGGFWIENASGAPSHGGAQKGF
jgi:hypothetical protein